MHHALTLPDTFGASLRFLRKRAQLTQDELGRAVGYSGVTVWSPEGKLLGRIRLPEVCGNVTFGGPKRNRLFICGTTSIYSLYLAVNG